VKKYLPYAVVVVLTLMAADRLKALPGLNKLPSL